MSDETFSRSVRIERPAAEVFAWHERAGALARLCPPWERVELVSATGGVRDGARVTVRNKVGPFWTEWRVEHRDYVAGKQFRDVQTAGPFARWEHLHRDRRGGAGGVRVDGRDCLSAAGRSAGARGGG
jgi:ligand-binding SRPBCC domain-containing protein